MIKLAQLTNDSLILGLNIFRVHIAVLSTPFRSTRVAEVKRTTDLLTLIDIQIEIILKKYFYDRMLTKMANNLGR